MTLHSRTYKISGVSYTEPIETDFIYCYRFSEDTRVVK